MINGKIKLLLQFMNQKVKGKLWEFDRDVSSIALPSKFTYPFYYQPHELAKIAVQQLQNYLQHEFDAPHNFGLGAFENLLTIGKMFGVLVVLNQENQLCFLAGFSGKIGESNHFDRFVPPVYDILKENSFFLNGEQNINKKTIQLVSLENDERLLNLRENFRRTVESIEAERLSKKTAIKANKKLRDQRRKVAKEQTLNTEELEDLHFELAEASKKEQLELKWLQKKWFVELENAQVNLNHALQEIEDLKTARKAESNALQHEIFEQYQFFDAQKIPRSLNSIFEETVFKIPPAGAGECAAPKLLHYAFSNQLKPICMAEFWWGASPKSEIRKHQNYYPACKGKCEPILGHMLRSTELDENPLLTQKTMDVLEILYEDEDILAIHKPSELLSVPGNTPLPSVLTMVNKTHPELTGPIIVHRLDMSTSGVMLLAKNEKAYFNLQRQFIKRKTKKTYVALLDGKLEEKSGSIQLPLTQDILDRPKQKVDFENGKEAITYWEKLEERENQTVIKFFPHTGRTHQLRVHAAHMLGLNAPIVGDDLYGTVADRLHLYAWKLTFIHPTTNVEMTVKTKLPLGIK